jgi:hypothetical protein
MSQMINTGKELLRISPQNPARIEGSTNGGWNWQKRRESVALTNISSPMYSVVNKPSW